MFRALVPISQRTKLPQAMLLLKSIDYSVLSQIKLRQSSLLTHQLVRSFASDNHSVKGGVTGVAQGGIIGSIGSNTPTMGHAGDAACGQVQTATFGNEGDGKMGSKPNEGNTKKLGTISSQLHTTSPLPECSNIGTIESTTAAQQKTKKAKVALPCKDNTANNRTSSASNLADDAVKQLQDVAANLPSKAQVEKFTFRVLAFVYDITYLTVTWTIRFVNEKILQNDTVKYYWKRFHQKMEEAKKD